jgi:hypothetical protein
MNATHYTNGTATHDTDCSIDCLYSFWPGPVQTPTQLPEAPASVNCHILIEGRPVQLTLRDTDEHRLLERLKEILKHYPLEASRMPQEQRSPSGETSDKGWCAKHAVAMTLNQKHGKQWWSHRLPDDQGGLDHRAGHFRPLRIIA